MTQASSPICPFLTLADFQSFGKPADAETNLGLSLLATDSLLALVTFVLAEPLDDELLELEQLYSPLTIERERRRP